MKKNKKKKQIDDCDIVKLLYYKLKEEEIKKNQIKNLKV